MARQYKSVQAIKAALEKAREHCKLPGQTPGLLLDEDDINPLIDKLTEQHKKLESVRGKLGELQGLDRERQRALSDQYIQDLLALSL